MVTQDERADYLTVGEADRRFERIDERFERVEDRFKLVEQRLKGVEQQLGLLGERIVDLREELKGRFQDFKEGMEARLADFKEGMDRGSGGPGREVGDAAQGDG